VFNNFTFQLRIPEILTAGALQEGHTFGIRNKYGNRELGIYRKHQIETHRVQCIELFATLILLLFQYHLQLRKQLTVQCVTGDSLFLQGAWRKTAGLYHDSLLSIGGCDSIVHTNFSLYPTLI